MGDQSAIEWTEATWNPIRGCSRVSEGCRNCYAERQAVRLAWPHKYAGGDQTLKANQPGPYYGLVKSTAAGPRWTGKVAFAEDVLDAPLRWTKPRRIFVNSMSDLFHEDVHGGWLAQIFSVMLTARQHTYQILTKRPERMLKFLSDLATDNGPTTPPLLMPGHIWFGVSVEDQATADERIPLLLETPAAVRWVSYEPALGPVSFFGPDSPTWNRDGGLDWIVVGGESGPGARPFDLAWARQTITQGRAAGVPVFVKQIGSKPTTDHRTRPDGESWVLVPKDRKGGDPAEWPADLRVREYPN